MLSCSLIHNLYSFACCMAGTIVWLDGRNDPVNLRSLADIYKFEGQ